MAIEPQALFPNGVSTGDPGYPFGKARNQAVPDDGTGTPLEEQVVNDLFGLQQSILIDAELTPTGTPDAVGASQYLDGLKIALTSYLSLARVKSWTRFNIGSPNPTAITYDPLTRRWLRFTTASSFATGSYSISGAKWVGSLDPHTGMGQQFIPVCAAANPAGVILVGGVPASASAQKIGRSVDGGDTFAPVTIGTSTTDGVRSLAWSAALGLWVASVDGHGLYSSPDGITWTLRSVPGAGCRWISVRDTPTPLIVVTGLTGFPGTGTSYYTSPDGVTWTAQTFPSDTYQTFQGCWSDWFGQFFQASGTGLYSSTDGIAWTLQDVAFNDGPIAAQGRVLMRGDGKATVDGTWIPVLEVVTEAIVPSPYGGLLAFDATAGDFFVSLQGPL